MMFFLFGPDLINSILGVLIRFRKEDVAVMADVEHMFFLLFSSNPSSSKLPTFFYGMRTMM